MKEITVPTMTRGWEGTLCEVWVDGTHVRIRLKGEVHLSDLTPAQLEQLAQDLAAASNLIREFTRVRPITAQGVTT